MTTNAPSGPPTVRQPPQDASLSPIDFSSAHERQILYDQRILCGWNEDKIPKWAKSMENGERKFFWITLPPLSPSPSPTSTTPSSDLVISRGSKDVRAVGHIALDKVDVADEDKRADTSLANPEDGILTITSLFVHPGYTRLGLGAFAMGECERLARVPPYGDEKCVAVTVNTLSSRYCKGGMPGPEGLGMLDLIGVDRLPDDNRFWYEKRGYVWYKEEERYSALTTKGDKIWMFANFLRKELV